MRLETVPSPVPSPDQVLVRMEAAGVNPVDGYIRSGTYRFKPPLPYTPGSDGAGTVSAAGEQVRGFREGDRVYIAGSVTGSYAEMALCRATQVHALPARLSFAQGAAIHIPYATAYAALFRRAMAVSGETVLVHGASGGVGIAAVQLARAAGLTVYGTTGSEAGRQAVLEAGAHAIFDHREPGHFQQIADRSGGKGVNIILEMLANVNLGHDLKLLAPRGRVVVVGSRGLVEIDPRDTISMSSSILGMSLMNTPEEELSATHRALATGLEDGTLTPRVRVELPLAEATKAHELVMQPGAVGKIVLAP